MKPQNLTALNLLSQQVSYRPHISMEEIPNLGNFSVNKETKVAQMTIFYGGEVIVFDDILADKAKEIMSIASEGNNFQCHNNNYAYTIPHQSQSSFPSPNMVRSCATPTTPQFPFLIPNSANNSVEEHPQAPSRSVVCDLPLARKASLHRFLEKRKDRIAARAPYQTTSPMSWLAMVPKSPQENSETSSSVV